MATKTVAQRRGKKEPAKFNYQWTGKDRRGRLIKGEITALGEAAASSQLRRQGISVIKIRKSRKSQGKKIKPRDIAQFTRQLSTMMKAGIPLIQSFEISAQGNPNARVAQLLDAIRKDVESGSSMSSAFRKHPMYFDDLYCNLVEAGETGGILEDLLDRLATYLEKTEELKRKVKGALIYPMVVISVVVVVIAIMMIFVIPTFKTVFEGLGANLPGITLAVMATSDFFVSYWWIIFGAIGGGIYFFKQTLKRSPEFREKVDAYMLRMPLFGNLVTKSAIARWTRTLATMFSAGVPLVDSLTAVGGASGNAVFNNATQKIRQEVTAGTSLTVAMGSVNLFPTMVTQMTSIGEESGALDEMLNNVADFYEAEVDALVKGLSAMIEPLVICVIAVVIGFILVAMYLPIFQLGSIV